MLEEVVAHTLQIITGVLMRNVALLSAVVGVITLFVVSLTGVVLETLGFTVLRSELDHLYYCGTWCVRFDVSLLVARVGGGYANAASAGLWYWHCNDDSSIVWDDIGARLLI